VETANQAIDRIDELRLNGFPHDHVQLVCDTVVRLRPDIICEWGTNAGNSARLLYEASTLSPCPVHSIENADQGTPPLLEGLDITLHHGNGLTITMALTHGKERPLILIDDHHVYQDTYDNLVALRERRKHAVILIHDAGAGISEASTAVRNYLKHCGGYDMREAPSEHGLVRLWPQSTST
jgi:hypothetical protein